MDKCELCNGVAKMYCESDKASLCWDCDVKVHGANFLAAKHTRSLLCSACQSLTPWKASGVRLGPTVTICESCLARNNGSLVVAGGRRNRNMSDFDGDRLSNGAESYSYGEEDEEEEEEVESQVLPWDAAAERRRPPSPMVSSSCSVSNGGEDFSGDGSMVEKRTRRSCSSYV